MDTDQRDREAELLWSLPLAELAAVAQRSRHAEREAHEAARAATDRRELAWELLRRRLSANAGLRAGMVLLGSRAYYLDERGLVRDLPFVADAGEVGPESQAPTVGADPELED